MGRNLGCFWNTSLRQTHQQYRLRGWGGRRSRIEERWTSCRDISHRIRALVGRLGHDLGRLYSACRERWGERTVKASRKLEWAFFFVLLGYVGAAIFYCPLVGVNAQVQIGCPLCPHIDSLGNPAFIFLRRVLVLGTLNALTFSFVGWLVVNSGRLFARTFLGPQRKS